MPVRNPRPSNFTGTPWHHETSSPVRATPGVPDAAGGGKPRSNGTAATLPVRATPEAKAGAGVGAVRRRLLVADDEECVRSVVALALRRRGYEVALADDGATAVEALRRAPEAFDGVMLDLTMPRMGGLEALDAMRRVRPRLPAILISGHGQQRLLEGRGNVDAAVLRKPFDVEELCAAVASVLGGA